ncbi:MAG TPA: ImmA/IrrE family metallo-endopeptidase [Microbacterium sp.]|nr:ImmA/IrrE family metallo-endopeptidase [Microbacterium sp.]
MERATAAANQLGYAVMVIALPGDVLACTVPALKRIFVDCRLTEDEQRAHLWHEVGHVFHGHACDKHARTAQGRANERQADRFAARKLIDPAKYAALEAVNPDQHHLADELSVPVEYIHVYEQDCLTRVRGTVYTHAREGVGQWAHRAEVA